jgi:hypothetical protein
VVAVADPALDALPTVVAVGPVEPPPHPDTMTLKNAAVASGSSRREPVHRLASVLFGI